MKTVDVRGQGYEALFYVAGLASLAVRPSLANAIEVDAWLGEMRDRREGFKRLRERGLVARSGGVGRLTELGRVAMAGGRDPEAEWEREWDGQWRILSFDIPRDAGKERTRFWRWLKSRHFGRLQGSVWIAPLEVSDVAEAAAEIGVDPGEVLLVTGTVSSGLRGAALAERAWDFETINGGYGRYRDFVQTWSKRLKTGKSVREHVESILSEDRKLWWKAIRPDPLLPGALHPSGYEGPAAWKARQEFHGLLFDRLGGRGAGGVR